MEQRRILLQERKRGFFVLQSKCDGHLQPGGNNINFFPERTEELQQFRVRLGEILRENELSRADAVKQGKFHGTSGKITHLPFFFFKITEIFCRAQLGNHTCFLFVF